MTIGYFEMYSFLSLDGIQITNYMSSLLQQSYES